MASNVSSYLFGRPGCRQTVRDVSRQLVIASDFRATHPATHSFVLRDCWKIATELWVLIQMPVAFEFPIDRRWMAVQFHRNMFDAAAGLHQQVNGSPFLQSECRYPSIACLPDRQSAVEGKRGSVREEIEGGRDFK